LLVKLIIRIYTGFTTLNISFLAFCIVIQLVSIPYNIGLCPGAIKEGLLIHRVLLLKEKFLDLIVGVDSFGEN
jgi:hypothetical protein